MGSDTAEEARQLARHLDVEGVGLLAERLSSALAEATARADREAAARQAAEAAMSAGCAELRRYVEGNGFLWQSDQSAVFNATTAIGLLAGQAVTATERMHAAESRARALAAQVEDAIAVADGSAADLPYVSPDGGTYDRFIYGWRNGRALLAGKVRAALAAPAPEPAGDTCDGAAGGGRRPAPTSPPSPGP